MREPPVIADIANASDEDLRAAIEHGKLSNKQFYAIDAEIERRRGERQKIESAALEKGRRERTRAELADNPFDPRSEVSADAKHIAGKIVQHLWIIFVLLPVMLAILYSLLK